MINLYITRHGETIWNNEKRMQGWLNSDLTEIGIQNAKSLGESLKDTEFKAIYSSPSGRTRETSKLILRDRTIPLIFDMNLREMNFGIWEGKTVEFIQKNYPIEIEKFWNSPHTFIPIEGESFNEVQDRVLKFIEHIKLKYTDGNILIVTHSVIIKSFLSIFKNLPVCKLWDPPYIHDTSLTVVELTDDKYKIHLEGSVSHKQIN